jgi:hypothetical protein
LSETDFRADEAVLKQSHPTLCVVGLPEGGSKMRTLIFSIVLLAVAAAGFYTLVSASIAASRDTKAATFAERFDAALPSHNGR